jgi:WD40 repeat protein
VHHLRADLLPAGQQIDHRGAVSAIAFAADGMLITAASDRSVRASRLERGETSILLQAHGPMQVAALAPGGGLMASSDGETTVQLWQLSTASGAASGKFWRVLRGLRGRPRVVCFGQRAEALAVAGEDGSVQIWRVADLEAEREGPQISIAGAGGRVRSLAFSPDASYLAAGIETGQVQIWHADNAAATDRLGGQGPAVVSLAFAPDGRSLASGDSAGQVWVWRLPSAASGRGRAAQRRREATATGSIVGHAGAVEQLAFSPAGGLLASGSSDGTVRLWRV